MCRLLRETSRDEFRFVRLCARVFGRGWLGVVKDRMWKTFATNFVLECAFMDVHGMRKLSASNSGQLVLFE